MTDHKQQLQSQLWNIANVLRGNMGADELGSIIEDTVWRRVDIISEDLSPLLLDKYKFQERKQIVNKLFNSVNEYAELYYKGW
jgi:type I restriction enzyme M protein